MNFIITIVHSGTWICSGKRFNTTTYRSGVAINKDYEIL